MPTSTSLSVVVTKSDSLITCIVEEKILISLLTCETRRNLRAILSPSVLGKRNHETTREAAETKQKIWVPNKVKLIDKHTPASCVSGRRMLGECPVSSRRKIACLVLSAAKHLRQAKECKDHQQTWQLWEIAFVTIYLCTPQNRWGPGTKYACSELCCPEGLRGEIKTYSGQISEGNLRGKSLLISLKPW